MLDLCGYFFSPVASAELEEARTEHRAISIPTFGKVVGISESRSRITTAYRMQLPVGLAVGAADTCSPHCGEKFECVNAPECHLHIPE